jgi:hypothetical protein
VKIERKRRVVIINLHNGQGVTGELCFSWFRPVYRVRNAALLQDGQPATKIDGTVEVPRRSVLYVQIAS